MIFGIKEQSIILTHTMYCWLFATNIPGLLMTGLVVQGHILILLPNFSNKRLCCSIAMVPTFVLNIMTSLHDKFGVVDCPWMMYL